MPYIQPGHGDVHVNRPLTAIAVAFMQGAEAFIADRVFPVVRVQKKSDSYFVYPRGEWNRDDMSERAPGTESAGGTYEIADDNYSARVRARHQDIPDEIRANADDPLDLERDATQIVTRKGLLNREILWAASYFANGIWTFNADGVSAGATPPGSFDPTDPANNDKLHWNDAASTPIEDVRQGKRFVLEETGFMPNKLTVSRHVFDILLDHPDMVGRVDRGQTVGAAMVNRAALAALFEVDEVLVMDSIVNTAAKGQPDAHQFVAGKHGLLSYAPPTPGIMVPSAGYTFAWTGFLGAEAAGVRIKRFRMEHLETWRVEGQMAYAHKRVAADLGYFFNGIVA